jgi:hypothetical protein
VTILTSVHPVEWPAKRIQRRPAPGTRVLFGDHRMRLPAASREVPRESDFASPSRETSRFSEVNRGCSRSYSGSFLSRVSRRLAWSGNDNSRRSILDGSGSATAATARPLMRTRRLR